jgi:hypothetical protein
MYYVAVLVLDFLMLWIPIYCLAFANKRVGSIRAFGQTAPNDFSILGTKLLSWIQSGRFYWTVFGVPITLTILQSYVYGAVGIVPVIIYMLSKSSYLNLN